jgi:hypothetical protein
LVPRSSKAAVPVAQLRKSEPAPVADLGVVHAELVAVVPERERLRQVVRQRLEPREVADPVRVGQLGKPDRARPAVVAEAQLGFREIRRGHRIAEPFGQFRNRRVGAIGGGLRFGAHWA